MVCNAIVAWTRAAARAVVQKVPGMDAASDPAPSEEAVNEATQALLARNATIIHTLIRE